MVCVPIIVYGAMIGAQKAESQSLANPLFFASNDVITSLRQRASLQLESAS